jgi:tRNA1(Val) A37 N6-methylase TrmN6
VQNNNATFAAENAKLLVVEENAQVECQDIPRFTTPAGLNLFMG